MKNQHVFRESDGRYNSFLSLIGLLNRWSVNVSIMTYLDFSKQFNQISQKFLLKRYSIFQSSFKLPIKLRGKSKYFSYPCLHTCISFPFINATHQNGTYFTRSNLQCQIITIQSALFTQEFFLGVVTYMDLGKYTKIFIHHYVSYKVILVL